MSTLAMTLTHEGVKYKASLARITGTQLHTEDHGIFTASLSVSYSDGGGTSIGGYALDEWDARVGKRVGTGEGLDYIKGILSVLGGEWEKVQGQGVIVLHPEDDVMGHGFQAVGIANPLELSKVFLFKSAFEGKVFP